MMVDDIVLQRPPSRDQRATQVATAPAHAKRVGIARTPATMGAEGEIAPLTRALEEGLTKSTVEEFFECVVEDIDDDAVRLRTRNLSGEEGIASLPIERIPVSERPHLVVGAPVRIAIVLNRDGATVRREHDIRVLRQSQWRAPVTPEVEDRLGEFMLERMRSLLR